MRLKCDSLDCKRRGSDNATGDIPFIAPMKTRLLKSSILENKQRCGVALLLCVCFALFALTPGAAQLRNQRRVTALQLGEAAEGSRVTVVSDSALNDYEAFRRGDRFYVKIPLADFTSAVPHFRADGFEDVQVQKVGDSLIVSFKLQPGATARVDQRANRLDVIFSAPNRSSYNAANAGTNRATPGSVGRDPQTSLDRGRDAAGPLPPGSVAASRDRVVTDRAGDRNESRAPQNPWVLTNPQNDLNKSSKRGAKDQSTSGNAAVTSPSPVSSPSSVLTPGTSSTYSPLTSATPAVSPTSRPVDSSSGSGGFLNWKRRGTTALQWASANWLATLLGALILLNLILYLAMALRSRQKKVVKAKRAKAPKVQPKYSADGELNELSSPSLNEQTALQVKSDPATAQAAAAGMSHNHERELTKPAIASPTAGRDEHSSEEEEREVFEL